MLNRANLNSYLLPKEPVFCEKTIWFFWDEDISAAPDIVQVSFHNWKQMNPDYEVVLLNNENCAEKTGLNLQECFESATAQIGTAGKTDFLRLYLLYHFGGVWVDATTFCLEPLNQWLKVDDESPFFCFKQPIETPDRQLVSWFLGARPKNRLVEYMLEQAHSYLFKERPSPINIGPIAIADQETYPQLVSRTTTGKAYLDKEEERGRVPYFWMFYLFNEAIQIDGLRNYFEAIDTSLNKYCQPHSIFSQFKQSYVSKQTYRAGLAEFKDRINYLRQNNMVGPEGLSIIDKALDLTV